MSKHKYLVILVKENLKLLLFSKIFNFFSIFFYMITDKIVLLIEGKKRRKTGGTGNPYYPCENYGLRHWSFPVKLR